MKPKPPQSETGEQNKSLEPIRAELNLEKWPIWRPAKSKNTPQARVLRREFTMPDGNTSIAQVEIAPTTKGDLTTEDQKTLYALIKQWQERGRSDRQTSLSLQRLAKLLGKGWGTNAIESIADSLLRLRITPFIWSNSYFDKSTGEMVEVQEDPFTILAELKTIKRKKDGHVTKEAGYFRFNELLLSNLLTNYTKPVLLEVVRSFKSEIAQIIYTHIDLVLSDKTKYERRTKELFADLGLTGKAYKNLSDRKRTLERALRELEGKPLSTGVLTTATLEPTKDETDYKVVFCKGRRMNLTLPPLAEGRGETRAAPAQTRPTDPSPVSSSPAPPTESSLRKDALELRVQGAELVKHFHELFHGSDRTHLSSKAIDQAVSLIAQHGFDQARHIVGFAHKAAPETGYQPQTFGGILQYTARALSTYQQDRLDEARAQAHAEARRQMQAREQEQQRQEKAEQERDDQRLALLADEQRLSLYHQAADIVLKKLPWLAKANPSGPMFQSMVRAEMLDLLTTQEQGRETTPDPNQT